MLTGDFVIRDKDQLVRIDRLVEFLRQLRVQ
jgi:hypothetical protein